jgi:hypothetical protein
MVNMKLFLLPLALLLIAMPVSMAAGTVKQDVLTGAYDDVKCHTDMEVSVMGAIDSAVPQASLSTYSDKLTSDTSQLQTYATSGDGSGFSTYLKGTYEPDVKAANQAVRDARKNFRSWNVSKDTIQSLRESYNSSAATFQSCKLSALQEVANGRVQAFQTVLSTYTDRMNNLSSKGLDTTGMSSAISGAQSTIITPLQNAISGATTVQELQTAVRGYCLANGCANGQNYHFYAKFDEAKLQAILDYIKPNATAAGLGAQVTQAQSALDGVQSALNAVGPAKYDPTDEKAVWDGLKSAASDIKGIMKSMRGNQTG